MSDAEDASLSLRGAHRRSGTPDRASLEILRLNPFHLEGGPVGFHLPKKSEKTSLVVVTRAANA